MATDALPVKRDGSILPARLFERTSLVPGWSVFEAQARTVRVDALRWPRSIQTYEDMTRDPQIQGLLMSVYLPIRHMQWYLDPNGAQDTLVQEISEDFGLPLLGDDNADDTEGVDHDEHLRLALLALAAGHKYFEESGEIVGEGSSQRYRLRRLDEYPNEYLFRIDVTSGGDLVSVRVNSADPATDGPFVDLPADHLLPYVWDRRGADWAGRPLLHGIYKPWLLKDDALRVNGEMLRRFSGIPYMETTQPDVSLDQHQTAAQLMQALRSGETSGFSAPYGLKPHIMGIEGGVPDAVKTIEYLDQQMARAFMQMFAELGNTKNGSRALGATLVDHYALGVLSVAKWIRKSQMTLVRRIAERNYGPGVRVPLIKCRQDDNEDMPLDQLVQLVECGAIIVDDDLEAQIRDRGNLVPRNPDEQGRALPKATPPSTPITTGVQLDGHDVAAAAAKHIKDRKPATAASSPADLSQTDFAGLQAAYQQALIDMQGAWADVHAQHIDQLVNEIATATTVADLAAIAAPAATGAVLLVALNQLVDHGAESVVDSAVAQGGALTKPSLLDAKSQVSSAADATAILLSRGLAQSAASYAVGLWGANPDPAKVAADTRTHLEALSGNAVDYEFAGLGSHAQNEGRFTALEAFPTGSRFYASELNDTHTCEPCRGEDDSEFPSIAEARRDYPAGGFVGCKGGKKCRGTVVGVLPETPGQS